MKKLYTQLFGVLCMMLMVYSANAQYNLVYNDTEYELISSSFTPIPDGVITGEVGAIQDQCGDVGDVAGKVAMVRFTNECHPALTAEAAEQADAIAVIVCGIFSSASGELFFPGQQNTDVDIPSFTMAPEACEQIIAMGGTVSIEQFCDDSVPANAVWGSNGEGRFDGGLNGWTINGEAFSYEPNSIINRGTFYSGPAQVPSPSSCNGVVAGDSDYLDQSGICQSSRENPCVGELESPIIDLSSANKENLSIQFYQYSRNFQSNYSIIMSFDGGQTYQDTIYGAGTANNAGFNDHLETNGPTASENVTVGLCLDADKDMSQFRFKFRYESHYYFWAIDDVFILDDTESDIRVTRWAAGPPNYGTPMNSGDVIALLADLANQRNVNSTGVVLTAQVVEPESGEILSEATLDYGDVEGCNTRNAENRLFAETFEMPTTPGAYRLIYTVSSDDDAESSNNTRVRNFVITADTYSKVPHGEITRHASYPDEGYGTFANVYHVNNNLDENGNPYIITGLRASMGTGDDFVSGFVTASIYEWNDYNNDGVVDAYVEGGTDLPERTLLGSKVVTMFLDSDEYDDYTFDFTDLGIELKANTSYLCALHSSPANAATETHVYGINDEENFDYEPMHFAFSDGVEGEALNLPRYGSFTSLDEASDDNIDNRRLLQIYFWTLSLDMQISPVLSTEDINEDINVKVYPNPAVNNVVVDLALENISESVNLQFVDAQGRVVKSVNFENVLNDKLNVNINDLSTGVYMINIRTAEGFTSARFIKG